MYCSSLLLLLLLPSLLWLLTKEQRISESSCQTQRGRLIGGDPCRLMLFSFPPGLAPQLIPLSSWCNIGKVIATEQWKTNLPMSVMTSELPLQGYLDRRVWCAYFDCTCFLPTSEPSKPAGPTLLPSWEVCGRGLQKVFQIVGRMTHASQRMAEPNLHEIKWSRGEAETRERFVPPSANYRPEPVTVSKWEPARFCPDATIRAP